MMDIPPLILSALAFLFSGGVVLLLVQLLGGEGGSEDRLHRLADDAEATTRPGSPRMSRMTQSTLPRLGKALQPKDEKERTQLVARLYQAGLYQPHAMQVFLGVKMLLIVGPLLVMLAAHTLRLIPLQSALTYGALMGIFGVVLPGMYLEKKKKRRHVLLKRGLSDALDLIVICLEAGLTMEGSIRRVTNDLQSAHPELALELILVQRDTEVGRRVGEALHNFAKRSDFEEVRALAQVVKQAERYGSGIATALKVAADALRRKREQDAEAMAHMAGTWILIPTVLFIFPGVFIVILGPAVLQVSEIFTK